MSALPPVARLESLLRDALTMLEEGDALSAAEVMKVAEQQLPLLAGAPLDANRVELLRLLHARVAARAEVARRALKEEISRHSTGHTAYAAYRS
ncbi:MAG: hypothetical protein IT382_02375 [Deltaproteobacteria bacterium]|nr:hypothetical protein [Deltaproteobacteria bacterium]